MKPINKTYLLLGSIILLGLILRLIFLFRYGNFWDDEIFNFIYSQKPWPQGLIYWLWETNPPLHLLILKIWFFLFPTNELFARLPSVISGTFSIYFIYVLGKKMFSEKTGFLAALYLAIHPYNIFWSATARIYSFLMLLAILSTLFLYKQFFLGDNSRKTKILGAVINGLLIFAHLSSLLFFAGQFFAIALFKGKSAIISWIKYNLIPFALGAIWILASLYVKKDNNLSEAWFLNLSHSFQDFLSPIFNMIIGQIWTIPGLIITIFSCAMVLYNLYKTKSTNLLLLLTLIILPIILTFGLGIWHIKFIVAVLPLAVLGIAYSFLSLTKNAFSILLIAGICFFGLYNLWHTLPLTDWYKTELFFREYKEKNGFVFVYNNFILKSQIDKYLDPDIAQKSKTVILYKDMDWDEMIVKKNYTPSKLSDTEKNEWYKKNGIDNYSIVALLQNEFPSMTKLDDLFSQKGWKLKQPPTQVPVAGTYRLYIYEKN